MNRQMRRHAPYNTEEKKNIQLFIENEQVVMKIKGMTSGVVTTVSYNPASARTLAWALWRGSWRITRARWLAKITPTRKEVK